MSLLLSRSLDAALGILFLSKALVYPRPWAKPFASKGKTSFGSYDEGSQGAVRETAGC